MKLKKKLSNKQFYKKSWHWLIPTIFFANQYFLNHRQKICACRIFFKRTTKILYNVSKLQIIQNKRISSLMSNSLTMADLDMKTVTRWRFLCLYKDISVIISHSITLEQLHELPFWIRAWSNEAYVFWQRKYRSAIGFTHVT